MDYTEYNAGHLTGQPMAEDVVVREPAVFEDPSCFASGPVLNPDEIAHFKEQGFIVKRRLIDDDAALAQAVEHLWANVPRGILRRDEPASWLDAPHEQWTDVTSPGSAASRTAIGRCARRGPPASAPSRFWSIASPTIPTRSPLPRLFSVRRSSRRAWPLPPACLRCRTHRR